MSGEVERIAKALTATQIRLLEWLDPVEFADWGEAGAPGNRTTRIRLMDLQLTESGERAWLRRLSPLGRAVRAYLQEQQHVG